MDITTIIIGIIIILCAALPIILTNYFRKRREKLALQGIQNLAEIDHLMKKELKEILKI